MKEISQKEARSLADRLDKSRNSGIYEFPGLLTGVIAFPKARRDVCVVRKDGFGIGKLYLFWRAGEEINYENIATDTYINLRGVYLDGSDSILEDGSDIVVKYATDPWRTGSPWDREYRRNKKELGLE